MKVRLLIPAAGLGLRLGAATPKALLPLCGQPLLVRTLNRFVNSGLAADAIVLAPEGYEPAMTESLTKYFPGAGIRCIAGGAQRQYSVERGLEEIDQDAEIVVVHDAARPFVGETAILASIDAAVDCGAATVAIPSSDTILVADDAEYLVETPPRHALWACQTPQTFRFDTLRRAHAAARADGFLGSDDASLVRRMGGRVKLVRGTPLNFKVTTPDDWRLAEAVIGAGIA